MPSRRGWLGSLAVPVLVAALAGCGGGGHVDQGGFSAHDRVVAQLSLDTLEHTNIPNALISMASAADFPPAACFVHRLTTKPATFEVFVDWQPYNAYNAYESKRGDYIFVDGTVSADANAAAFHVAYAASSVPALQAFALHQPKDVMTKPFEKCELLQNGYLRLVAATG
jgi:hypothetical protein